MGNVVRFKSSSSGTPEEAFERSVEYDPNTGCWLWSRPLQESGYGRFYRFPGESSAHRASYSRFKGLIPKGSHVLHRCDTPACVNPDHLFLGTPRDNVNDCLAKGRKPRTKPHLKNVDEILAYALEGPAAIRRRFSLGAVCVSRILRRHQLRVRDLSVAPTTVNAAISRMVAGIGALERCGPLSDAELAELNSVLTKFQLLLSERWKDRK